MYSHCNFSVQPRFIKNRFTSVFIKWNGSEYITDQYMLHTRSQSPCILKSISPDEGATLWRLMNLFLINGIWTVNLWWLIPHSLYTHEKCKSGFSINPLLTYTKIPFRRFHSYNFHKTFRIVYIHITCFLVYWGNIWKIQDVLVFDGKTAYVCVQRSIVREYEMNSLYIGLYCLRPLIHL